MSCSWIPRRLSWSSSNLICVKWAWKLWHEKYRVFTIHTQVKSLDWDMHNTQLYIILTIIFFAIWDTFFRAFFSVKEIFFNDALVSHCGLLKLQENKRMPREGSLLCAILPPSQRKYYPEHVSCFLDPVIINKVH